MPQSAEAAAGYHQLSGGVPSAPAKSVNQSEEELVDLVKGKAPVPPTPKAPSVPPEFSTTPSYKHARKKRKENG